MGSYSRGILSPLRLPFRHVRGADLKEVRAAVVLEHDPEKWKPAFRRIPAPSGCESVNQFNLKQFRSLISHACARCDASSLWFLALRRSRRRWANSGPRIIDFLLGNFGGRRFIGVIKGPLPVYFFLGRRTFVLLGLKGREHHLRGNSSAQAGDNRSRLNEFPHHAAHHRRHPATHSPNAWRAARLSP